MLPLLGLNGEKTPSTYATELWSGWVGELKSEQRAERLWTLVLLWEIPMDWEKDEDEPRIPRVANLCEDGPVQKISGASNDVKYMLYNHRIYKI